MELWRRAAGVVTWRDEGMERYGGTRPKSIVFTQKPHKCQDFSKVLTHRLASGGWTKVRGVPRQILNSTGRKNFGALI